MATVTPPLHTIKVMTPGDHAEIQVLRQLASDLPDAFHLFHSVDWAQANPRGDSHGEVDVVVVNQGGDVALLEIKAGEVQFTPQGMFKQYGHDTHNVSSQVHWQFKGIQHRLRDAGLDIRLQHFLVLPEVRVGTQAATIGFPGERILDETDCQALGRVILSRLGSGLPNPIRERVCSFFQDRLQCKVDVAALSGRLQSWTQHLSGGLAEWVPRIHAPSRVIRVQGTAGSGKTQLALSLLHQATTAGRQAAYVCFNRPLADHMRALAPRSCEVLTFHQLCWNATHPVDAENRAASDSFAPAELSQSIQSYQAKLAADGPDLDVLIVDELQDFEGDWLVTLVDRVRMLQHGTQATSKHRMDGLYLLDDPDQCLYADREEVDIDEAVVVSCRENHRSPRRVVDTINQLRLSVPTIQARSPFAGDIPAFRRWRSGSADSLKARTADAVQACLDAGFEMEQICVLTWRGRERSLLMNEDQLGTWSLSRYTGRFDAHSRPVFTEGVLRVETLRRFKGQSSPAVVLTEIDFDTLGDLERRMLFVGMTRASMHLEMVMTDRAESLMMQRVTHSDS